MKKQDFFKPVTPSLQATAKEGKAKTIGANIRFLNIEDDFTSFLSADIAIMGLISTPSSNFNSLRENAYTLYIHSNNLNIVDLGDIFIEENVEVRLKELFLLYAEQKTLLIILGDSPKNIQYIIKGINQEKLSVSSISPCIDLSKETNVKYLNNDKLFNLNILGHQLYMTNPEDLEFLSSKYYTSTRLGTLRNAILKVEPEIRDSSFICIDLGSVRVSDAPCAINNNSNGLYAEEVCQLARYAGLSENLKISYINGFELNPNYITNSIISQIIWHLMDGYIHRIPEKVLNNANGVQKIIVNLESPTRKLLFFHSNLTKRWWMEVYGKEEHSPLIIACLREDYTDACNHELPLKWLWYHQKLLYQK